MTPRAIKALEVLNNGGYFRKALETQYRGGEKFEYRLREKNGMVVRGIGFATHYELLKAGYLTNRACERSTVWPEEWVLSREALAA